MESAWPSLCFNDKIYNSVTTCAKKNKEKSLSGSTARRFVKLYKEEVKDAAKAKHDPKNALAFMARRCPLLLQSLDENVSKVFHGKS